MTTVWRIARYAARDLVRSRWLAGYGAFLVVATTLLLRFSDVEEQALLSLSSVVLLVVPLANVVFGAMYLYGSREFVELLLSQPVRRSRLYAGLLLGLVAPVASVSYAGIVVPLLVNGVTGRAFGVGATIASAAAILGAVFLGIAAVIAYSVEDRLRGLGVAIGAWLALAVAYDAAVLWAAVSFADYPLDAPLLAAMFANPIDLARVTLLQQFDAAALLGYTGALFRSWLGGSTGVLLVTAAAVFWLVLPAVAAARLFNHKDF